MIQKLWNTANAVLRGIFIAIQSYSRKQEKSQINNLILSKATRERTKSNTSRRKEIIKMRAKIKELETKKTTEKSNEIKTWFSEKRNETDKPLARFIKKKMERGQINKVRNEKGEVTAYTTEIQRTSNCKPIQHF